MMDDLISRQAAIDAIWEHLTKILENTDCDLFFQDVYKMAHRHLAELIQILPSAEPETNGYQYGYNQGFIDGVKHEQEKTSAQPELCDDAVSRRRLLNDLEELTTSWEKYPVMADRIKGVEAAIGYVKTQPSAEPEQRWIPVTEQTLPKHNSVVVVCGNKGTWDYGTYRGHTPNHIDFWNWKKNTVKEVHWWMYKADALPEPWKGESDG